MELLLSNECIFHRLLPVTKRAPGSNVCILTLRLYNVLSFTMRPSSHKYSRANRSLAVKHDILVKLMMQILRSNINGKITLSMGRTFQPERFAEQKQGC